MGLFNKKKPDNKLKELIKEREKKEKQLEKDWEKRINTKYTADNLKAAKNMMMSEAMKIDPLEYQKIAQELKDRIKKD